MRLRARLLIAGGTLLLAGLLYAETLFSYLGPFLLALLLASVVDPAVDRLERAGISRGAAALAVIAAGGSTVAAAAWLVAVNLLREFEMLRSRLPEYALGLQQAITDWTALLRSFSAGLPHPVDDALEQAAHDVAGLLTQSISSVLSRAGSLPSAVMVGLVASTTAYFLVRDKRQLGRFLLSLLPRTLHPELRRLHEEIFTGLLGFVKAQCILVAISGALSVAGFLAFGYRYAWLLGTLAGVLDIVPMVGPSGVFLPVILWSLIAGEWPRAAGIAAVWAVVLIVRQLVEPEVVARHVGLHPVTSVVAVYLGGRLLGVNGILLGPAVAVVLKAIFVVSVLPLLTKE
mgnify:CR=1 FL=1